MYNRDNKIPMWVGGILLAVVVIMEGVHTRCSVALACAILGERQRPGSNAVPPGSVANESAASIGRIVGTGRIEAKCIGPRGGISVSLRVSL